MHFCFAVAAIDEDRRHASAVGQAVTEAVRAVDNGHHRPRLGRQYLGERPHGAAIALGGDCAPAKRVLWATA